MLFRSVTKTILADTAAAIRGADAGGTVTSVATNNGSGITGGTITTTGTLAIDTLLISTRAWRQKGVDSVAALINNNVAGISGYVSKFSGTHTIDTSQIYQSNGLVGVGTTSPTAKLSIKDSLRNVLDIQSRSQGGVTGLNVRADGVSGFAAVLEQRDSVATGTQYQTVFKKGMLPGTGNPAPGGGIAWYTAIGNDNNQYMNTSVYRSRLIDTSGFAAGSGAKTTSIEFWTRKNNSWDTTLVLNGGNVKMPSLPQAPGTKALRIDASGNISYADTLIDAGGTVTSVGLTMPAAFSVAGSPVTSSGTLAVTGAGLASQYIRGDGTLANFPGGGGGGGSSVSYYLNGSVNQGTFVGNTYYQMANTPVIGAGTDFSIAADGYITQFITNAGNPALLNIPAGNWNFEMYFSASSAGGTPTFYVELYKYNGTTFTLIASSSTSPETITGGTATDLYLTSLAVPATSLTLTDRLAVRVYVIHDGRTITLHTQDNTLCQVITTFTTGITALNTLTAQVQIGRAHV